MIFGGKKKKNTAISDCVERSGIYPFIITKRLRYALLPVTVTLTLHTDVITQEGTEDEVLLGRELVQRTGTISLMASRHSRLPKKRLTLSPCNGEMT